MTTPSFTNIFTAYWTQYRGDSDVPASTDDEFTIALRLANEALNHWATYDGTYWKELFTTLQDAADGDQTITTDDKTYSAPTNFLEAGGFVKVKNDEVTVLTENAERAEEIDEARAEAARARAEQLMTDAKSRDDVDYSRLVGKLERELTRLKVARKRKYKDVGRPGPSQ